MSDHFETLYTCCQRLGRETHWFWFIGLKVKVNHTVLIGPKHIFFMRRPESFAGAFIICNWIVCPSFCPLISPFVNYSLSLIYKVQYLDFEWSQSIQSKVQCKFIDGLLTRKWHYMPVGVCEGSKYMQRAWIFCKILTLLPSGAFVIHELYNCCCTTTLKLYNCCCTTTLKFSIDSGSLGQSSRSFWQSTFGTLFAQQLCKTLFKLYSKK